MVACVALLPSLALCGQKQKVAIRHFVPPSPAPVSADTALIEGPEFDSRLLAKELPLVFGAAAPASRRVIEAELRLGRAEERFQKGKELAAKGELPAARLEFDNAIEEIAGASPSCRNGPV